MKFKISYHNVQKHTRLSEIVDVERLCQAHELAVELYGRSDGYNKFVHVDDASEILKATYPITVEIRNQEIKHLKSQTEGYKLTIKTLRDEARRLREKIAEMNGEEILPF